MDFSSMTTVSKSQSSNQQISICKAYLASKRPPLHDFNPSSIENVHYPVFISEMAQNCFALAVVCLLVACVLLMASSRINQDQWRHWKIWWAKPTPSQCDSTS